MSVWGIGISAAIGVGGIVAQQDASRKALHAGQDALKSQTEIAKDLKYQPIDLDKLRADASAQAIQNATQSLALERSLQPGVAGTREGLANSINSELAQGGKLSADVQNQVSQQARTVGGLSGIGGNYAPLTAAITGQTAQGLLQQRQDNAAGLLASNPLPVAGLDPGAIASVEVANNAAQNQFNLEKSGVASNLAQSQAGLQAGAAGANAAAWNSALGLVGSTAGKYLNSRPVNAAPVTTTPYASTPAFNSTIPQTSASGLWG